MEQKGPQSFAAATAVRQPGLVCTERGAPFQSALFDFRRFSRCRVCRSVWRTRSRTPSRSHCRRQRRLTSGTSGPCTRISGRCTCRQLGASRIIERRMRVRPAGTCWRGLRHHQAPPSAIPQPRPLPQFEDITLLNPEARSDYDSLQLAFTQRLTSGASSPSRATRGRRRTTTTRPRSLRVPAYPNFPQDPHPDPSGALGVRTSAIDSPPVQLCDPFGPAHSAPPTWGGFRMRSPIGK